MARPIQVRINLPATLKETIELLKSAAGEDAGDADSIRSNLAVIQQFSDHIDAVLKGEHSPKQLCDLYMIVGPPKIPVKKDPASAPAPPAPPEK